MAERARDKVSRFSSMALMVLILIVAGGISAITAMRLAIRGTEVVVPPLMGKTEDESRQILEENKLLLRVSSKSYSPTVPEGRVMKQIPPPGTRLKSSRSVKVQLSAGERKYAVPNLVGSSIRAAKLTLAQRNYTLGNTTVTRTANGDALTVQQQYPQPGSQEGADPTVNVLLSSGPFEHAYVMPDLVGKPVDIVAARARVEGFQLGKPTYRKVAGVAPGLVTQQRPQAGHRLGKNDSIILEVSQ